MLSHGLQMSREEKNAFHREDRREQGFLQVVIYHCFREDPPLFPESPAHGDPARYCPMCSLSRAHPVPVRLLRSIEDKTNRGGGLCVEALVFAASKIL